jgi:hypothetical protein
LHRLFLLKERNFKAGLGKCYRRKADCKNSSFEKIGIKMKNFDKDGIVYGGTPEEPISYVKIISVKILGKYTLFIKFNNGKELTYDFSPILEGALFSQLKDKELFDKVHISDTGALEWNEELDFDQYALLSEI